MDGHHDAVAAALEHLAGPGADGQAEQLAQARKALLSQPALLLESGERLAQAAAAGGAAAFAWVAGTYALAARHCPTHETLTAALRLGARGLGQPPQREAAAQLTAAALHAIYQDRDFRFADARLGEPLRGAAEAVAGVLASGPVATQVPALALAVELLVMLTAPAVHKKLGLPAAQVAASLQALLKQLLALLRGARGEQASCLSLAAVCAVRGAVLRRPGQAGRLLPGLLGLAGAPLPPGARASLHKALTRALLGLWAAEALELQAWKAKVRDALASLGVQIAAPGGGGGGGGGGDGGDARPDQAAASGPGAPPEQQPAQQAPGGLAPPATWPAAQADPALPPPPQQQQHGHAPQAAAAPAAEEATSRADVDHVLAIVAALLAENDQATCLAFAGGLPAAVLADVVIANMARLPRPEAVLQAEAAAAPGAAVGGGGLLAGLMQATGPQPQLQAQAQAQPQPQQPPAPPTQPQQVPPPRPAAAPAAIALRPAQLTAAQAAAVRRGALQRLLAARAAPCRRLQGALLARLAPQLQDEAWSQALVADIVARQGGGGLELALQWLHALYAASPAAAAAESLEAAGEGGGAGGVAGVQPSEAYTRCLQLLLQAFRERLPAKDRTTAQLLVEAPALPPELLRGALGALAAGGGERATLALVAARDLILLRPGSRQPALQALLRMAVSADPDVRGKAVRLVANKIFPNPLLTAAVEAFAAERLQRLAPAGSKRPREGGGDAGGAKKARTEPAASAAEPPAAAGEGTARADGGGEPAAAHGGGESVAAANGAGGDGDAGGGAAADQSEAAAADAAAAECELYCALCTKRHALLRALFAAFGRAGPAGRGAVLRNAEGLARVLGGAAPALLALVDDTPPGAETLLLRMLYFLTEAHPPPPALVDACRRRFEASRDASFLPPALAGMAAEEVGRLLPRLLEPPALLDAALDRLLLPLPSRSPAMSATQVLLALLGLQPARDGVRLKQVMTALDACLARRQAFGREALAAALQQLAAWPSLPPLYMRFLMQCQAAAPGLRPFLLEQLAAAAGRQIWTDRTLFTGWNLAVRQNVPDSFPAFLQLPTRVLAEALQAAPAAFRAELREWSGSPACPANQRAPILRVLDSVQT